MLADMLGVEHRDATELGYIQHKPLQWDNECTRHKLLDIIGDMALNGLFILLGEGFSIFRLSQMIRRPKNIE